jgi:hypothetical protein
MTRGECINWRGWTSEKREVGDVEIQENAVATSWITGKEVQAAELSVS